MVTTIRVRCPDCGEQRLPHRDVVLRLHSDPHELVAEGSVYRFVCPDCHQLVEKPADARLAALIAGCVPLAGLDDLDDSLGRLLDG